MRSADPESMRAVPRRWRAARQATDRRGTQDRAPAREQRLGPVLIAAKLGIPALTVHAVLVWCRLNRRRLAFAPIGPPRGAHST